MGGYRSGMQGFNGGSRGQDGGAASGGGVNEPGDGIGQALNDGLVAKTGNPENTPPKKEINVFVSPRTRDDALKMSYDEAKRAENNSDGKLVVIEVDDLSHLIRELIQKTKNGVKVKTMIIDSHGGYINAKALIGSTVIRNGTGKKVEELGKFFVSSQQGEIVLLACHAGGNTINNGEKFIENLSCTTGTRVYGSRSWTGAIGLFDGLNPSLPSPERFRDDESELGWKFLGQWNYSTNGVPVKTLKNGIHFTSEGNVKHNIISPVRNILKGIKKLFF